MIRRLICAITGHETRAGSIVVRDPDGIQVLTLAQCDRCKDFAFHLERIPVGGDGLTIATVRPNGGTPTE